jgi:hypothetical protein
MRLLLRARDRKREGVAPVTMTNWTTTAAALRPRTLSALGSPFTQSTGVAAWRRVPTLGVPAGMRDIAVSEPNHPTHNSIPAAIRSTVVPTANAGTNGYGAAKQAAPPRGVPR